MSMMAMVVLDQARIAGAAGAGAGVAGPGWRPVGKLAAAETL